MPPNAAKNCAPVEDTTRGAMQTSLASGLQSHHTPPWRVLRHIAELLDCLVGAICEGERIGPTGRFVLADSADKLRDLARAMK